MKYIHKLFLSILLSVTLISCKNEPNTSDRSSYAIEEFVPISEGSTRSASTQEKESIKPNNYKDKYFNQKFYATPGLRRSNNSEDEIISLVNELETKNIDRRKYYYYLLSKEEKVPNLSRVEKSALKVYMDKMFDLELEVVNFNRNAKQVNQNSKLKATNLSTPKSKFNNYSVKKNLATKPNKSSYVADKQFISGYLHKIDNVGEIPVPELPALANRMKFIQYRLKREVVEGAQKVNDTKRNIKDMRERPRTLNTTESRLLSRRDPRLNDYVSRPNLGNLVLDTIPIRRPTLDANQTVAGSEYFQDTSKVIMYSIIGEDNRLEPFDFDSPFQHFGFKVAALVHKKHLQEVNSTSYKIVGYELLSEKEVGIQGNYFDMCDPLRFGGQPSVSKCTGFAIGPNRIVTANHCMKFDASTSLDDYYWVFDYKMQADSTFMDIIPKSSVFKPTRLIKNQYYYENDFSMMEVTETIPSSRIIEDVVINDDIEFGDTLFMIGHPLGLPLKVCSVGLVTNLFAQSGYAPYFYCSLDAFEGNSGSPVFLKKNGKCVGFLSAGLSDFEATSVFESNETCAAEFIMPFELDRIEELVQKMEDVFLQLEN